MAKSTEIEYQYQSPPEEISLYVDRFWCLKHASKTAKDVILLPDGKIDILFSSSDTAPFQVVLVGLATMPDKQVLEPGLITFGISFNPLAMEYIVQKSVAAFVNEAVELKTDFWGARASWLKDFDLFCKKVSEIIIALLPKAPDDRKLRMQAYLLQSNGNTTVRSIEKNCFITSRALNRYWMQAFGIPLKTYLLLLRFRSAFPHIKKGNLYPEADYTDQSHFIKEVKRLSGHLPKELLRNQNDRFLQFSVLNPD